MFFCLCVESDFGLGSSMAARRAGETLWESLEETLWVALRAAMEDPNPKSLSTHKQKNTFFNIYIYLYIYLYIIFLFILEKWNTFHRHETQKKFWKLTPRTLGERFHGDLVGGGVNLALLYYLKH